MPQFREEEVIRVVRWRLGVFCDDGMAARDVWDRFQKCPDHAAVLQEVIAAIRHECDAAIERCLALGTSGTGEPDALRVISDAIRDCLKRDPAASAWLDSVILNAAKRVTGRSGGAAPAAPAPAPAQGPAGAYTRSSGGHVLKAPVGAPTAPTAPSAPTAPPPTGGAAPPAHPTPAPAAHPAAAPAARPAAATSSPGAARPPGASDSPPILSARPAEPATEAPRSGPGGPPSPESSPAPADAAAAAASQWKNLPVPDSEPDRHDEFDERPGCSPEGMKIVGARARGKKHKHEGTNCDDWFHFATAGRWTILAVSDGAGSKRFSRVGAKAACEAAVGSLTDSLEDLAISARDEWTADTFQEAELLLVRHQLERALHAAWEAVERAAAERVENAEHLRVLGRAIKPSDLSATLLVAVHTSVEFKGEPRSLVFGCSVGDGMIAVIDKNGTNRLLMTPDSGEHSGETRFLEPREIAPEKMSQRIFPFLGSMRALMLMSDGVADDYFPNDPGMSCLYGDLVLNGIIVPEMGMVGVAAAMADTALPTRKEVKAAEFSTVVESATADGARKVRLRSLKAYAEKLGLPPEKVWADLPLLVGGAAGEPMCDETAPEARLRVWLDSYQVRGSFDDRTLLVLHR